jgi:hypothetical protein
MIRAFSAALMTFAVLNVVMTAPAYARKNRQSVVSQQNVVTFDNDGRARTAGSTAQVSPRVAGHRAERVSRRHRTMRAIESAQAPFSPAQTPVHAPAHTPFDGRARAMADSGSRQAQILGGRPAGCPRQYCGCGTSIKLFGKIRPELNLAANWVRKFPRAAAAPGMAAARSGHVMLLMEPVSGDKWKVWDANSGGGLTRIHVRSIRGFAIVNPHATNVAQTTSSAAQ